MGAGGQSHCKPPKIIGLRSWQLSIGAAACIPPPPIAPPGVSVAWVVCALGTSPLDACRMASLSPNNGYLVVLVVLCRTSDYAKILSHCGAPLMHHPLPAGLFVGRASGAPLDIHGWLCPGVGENWLARGGGCWSPFPGPPPLLGSRDGALKKVIDGGK